MSTPNEPKGTPEQLKGKKWLLPPLFGPPAPEKITFNFKQMMEESIDATERKCNQWKQGKVIDGKASLSTPDELKRTYEQLKDEKLPNMEAFARVSRDIGEDNDSVVGEYTEAERSDMRRLRGQAERLRDEIRQSVKVVEQHLIRRDMLQKRVDNLHTEVEKAIVWLHDHFFDRKLAKKALTHVDRKLGIWRRDTAEDYVPCIRTVPAEHSYRNGIDIKTILENPLDEALRELGPCRRESDWTPVETLRERRTEILQCLEELRQRKVETDRKSKPIDETPEQSKAKIQKWAELTIDFIDNETIRYKAGTGQWKRANYAELGFKDKRKGLSNKPWEIFLLFAEVHHDRYIDFNINQSTQRKQPYSGAKKRAAFMRCKDRICRTLKDYFGPQEVPIKYVKKERRWQVKFTLSDGRPKTTG